MEPPGMPGHPSAPAWCGASRRPSAGARSQPPGNGMPRSRGAWLASGVQVYPWDASMFRKREWGMWILVYVDDLMLVANF